MAAVVIAPTDRSAPCRVPRPSVDSPVPLRRPSPPAGAGRRRLDHAVYWRRRAVVLLAALLMLGGITFAVVQVAGEVTTGQIRPATRLALRSWLERFDGRADAAFAVEGCTGWRFVVEELRRAGVAPHLAEPADTAVQRGRKKRAKTDRADARPGQWCSSASTA